MKSDEAFQTDPLRVLLARSRRPVLIDALKSRRDVTEVIPSGSLARGTHLGPVHDVDLIVVFDEKVHQDWQGRGSARAALEHTQTAIHEALKAGPGQAQDPVHDIELRNHAVAFKLDLPLGPSVPEAASVDVMPAIREGSYLRVPERSTGRWIEVDLESLRKTLATQRRAWSNFDEIVRMIKIWAHHQGLRIPSIAVEVLVLEYLPRPASSESMLSSDAIAGFFEAASRAHIIHLTDPAGRYGEIAPDLDYAALRAALRMSAALARQAVNAERAWPKRYLQDVGTHPSVFWQEIFGQDEFRRPRGWYWNLESPDERPSPQSRRWFDEQAEPPSIQPEDSAGSGDPQDGSQGTDGLEPDGLDGRASVTGEIAETDDRPSLGEVLDATDVIDPGIVDRLVAGDGEAAAVLARRGESQWVELKEKLPQDSELAKDLAALANSGGGVLIVGVADNGEATGWGPADADIAVRRMRGIAINILPDLAHIGHGPADNGWLAWAVVESADEPAVTAQGTYWLRTAGRVQRAELPSQGLIVRDPSASRIPLPEEGPIRVFVAMSFREEEEPALVDYWQAMLRAAKQARR